MITLYHTTLHTVLGESAQEPHVDAIIPLGAVQSHSNRTTEVHILLLRFVIAKGTKLLIMLKVKFVWCSDRGTV